ncbi:MAG: PorT family protein [Cytophagales bacterium]|nr:MAG: PorT family protein [Cytophagales bacterium]
MIVFSKIIIAFGLVANVSKHWLQVRSFSFFFIFIVLFFSNPCLSVLYAQEEDSKQTISNNKYKQIASNLEKLYANGELEEVIVVFRQSCLESDNDLAKERKEFKRIKNELKANIYSILCRACVSLDRPQLADRFLGKLFAIRADEDFQEYWQTIRETRSYDYYVAPRFQIGLSSGANIASPSPQEFFSIFNATNNTSANLTSEYNKFGTVFQQPQMLGFRIGGQVVYGFTKNISLTTLFSTSSLRFSYTDNAYWADSPNSFVKLFIRTERKSFHIVNYFDIPLLLRYQFLPKRNFKPYLLAGGFYGRTFTASKQVNIQEFPAFELNGVRTDLLGNASNARLDISDLMSANNYGLMAGIGTSYAYQYFRFSFSATYRYGINNIINPATRYNNQELVYGYHDVFDNISLNQLNFQFGIAYITYKAFKKRGNSL